MGSGRTRKSPKPKFTPFTGFLVQHSKRYGLTPCSAPESPFSEFTPADNTLLDEEDIQAIAEQVWPEEQDEDFAE